MGEIRYVERTDGTVRVEQVYGELWVRLLYGTQPGRLATSRWLVHPALSRLVGLWQDTPFSRSKLGEFVQAFGVDMTEAQKSVSEFKTFNEFFTRKLRPECRPVDRDPDSVVSPADGKLLVLPVLTADLELRAKGVSYSVRRLLAGVIDPPVFDRGAAAIVRLCPTDYHRFHFPDGGEAAPSVDVPGPLHSVNPFALQSGLDIFGENKRSITRLDSDGFGVIGIVEVGALCVGTIVQTFRPGRVERGTEKGIFRFGGSTVILLLQKDRVVFDDDLLANSRDGLETRVMMGSRIGRRAGARP